jgi:malate/lactate dehydrogenase
MPASIGIYGAAGAVGSAAAFALALTGAAQRLVLVDAARARLECLRMDLEALGAALPLAVEAAEADALGACPVVVACASVPHRDGAPRTAFLEENARILARLAEALGGREAWQGRLVLVTNPVDALATRLQRELGEERRSVLGYALNDSLRLRVAIARSLGCAAGDVEAWSVGEHGPHAVPLLSRVRVGRAPVALTPPQRAAVLAEVRGWYGRWQRLATGRTAAWSSGWGVAALVRALLHGDARPWPVSLLLRGEYGVAGVCLTAPVAFAGAGAQPRVLEWPLAREEMQAIAAAGEVVAAAAGEEARCASC